MDQQDNLAVKTKGIGKRFGSVVALDGIDLQVQKGSIMALLGPNGSGKTTLVRILTTLLRPDSGEARVMGYDVIHHPAQVRSTIGLAGQYPAVDDILTGRENLRMVGRLYHLPRSMADQRAGELLAFFELLDAADRPAKTYSGGMRRRLDLAASLVASPPILFLDEPTTGLDPRSRLGLWDIISEQAKKGTTVFLTTQYLEEADRLANQVAVLDSGQVLRQGTPRELKECCGGETVLQITFSGAEQMQEAERVLADNMGTPHVDPSLYQLTLPAGDGTSALREVLRRLDAGGVQITDIYLRRPTLDDVFLSITGHRPAPETPGEARRPSGRSKRKGRRADGPGP